MKNIFNYLPFLLMVLISIYSGIFLYKGNFWISQIFSLVFCGFLFCSIRSKNTFFIFLSILLWLGFWFKFNASLYINNGKLFEPVGLFDYSSQLYDNILIISSVGLTGFFTSYFLRNKNNSTKKIYIIKKCYINYSWVFIFIITILTAIINIKYSIYQRGTRGGIDLPIILTLIIQWMMYIGIISLSLILGFASIIYKDKNITLYLALILIIDFIISTSSISRGFIMSSSAIILLFIICCNSVKITNNYKNKIIITLIFIILCVLNLSLTTYIRNNFILDNSITNFKQNFEPSGGVNNLVFGRWVGLEGVASTAAYSDKGIELFITSLKEKKDNTQASFYDKNIIKDSPYLNIENKKYYAITLPGIIGYLNYSGSLIFIFFGCLLLGLFGNMIINCSNFLFYNPLVTGYIGYLIAYRYVSFGAYPLDSYKLILAIIFLIFIMTIIQNNKFLKRFFNSYDFRLRN